MKATVSWLLDPPCLVRLLCLHEVSGLSIVAFAWVDPSIRTRMSQRSCIVAVHCRRSHIHTSSLHSLPFR